MEAWRVLSYYDHTESGFLGGRGGWKFPGNHVQLELSRAHTHTLHLRLSAQEQYRYDL